MLPKAEAGRRERRKPLPSFILRKNFVDKQLA